MANMLSVVFRPKYNQYIFQFSKSKKLIQPVILKCAWRPNFIFFGICLPFIATLEIADPTAAQPNSDTVGSAIFKVA